MATGSDFTYTCSLIDLSDDGNDGDDPVAMARQLAQARLERLRAVQVVVGGEDEVQTGGLLASVPAGAATGEEVGQRAEGSSLAQCIRRCLYGCSAGACVDRGWRVSTWVVTWRAVTTTTNQWTMTIPTCGVGP